MPDQSQSYRLKAPDRWATWKLTLLPMDGSKHDECSARLTWLDCRFQNIVFSVYVLAILACHDYKNGIKLKNSLFKTYGQ